MPCPPGILDIFPDVRVLLCIFRDPLPGDLVVRFRIVLELLSNTSLHSIVWLRGSKHSTDKLEDVGDLVWWLPLFSLEHAKAHGAALIVGDVGVVDLRLEGEDWRLEGVLFREDDLDLVLAALLGSSVQIC